MATYARCEFDATDEAGNLLTDVQVEVRAETGGLPQLYADRNGTVPLGNPFTSADGKVAFHAPGNAYKVTLTKGDYARERRYVGVGLASETDLRLVTPQGAWSSLSTYAIGDMVSKGSGPKLFISKVEGNLNHAPDDSTPGDTSYWFYAGTGAVMPPPSVSDVLDALGVHSITISTSDPSGGVDGDIWFKVTA